MISEYHRPQTLEEALALLSKPDARPLGGGTVLNRPSGQSFAAVDLQALGLSRIHKTGNILQIGATATLQALIEAAQTPGALKDAIELEAPLNLRNAGTVAGALVASDGRSPFAAAMLALDAKCTWSGEQNSDTIGLGDLLPLREDRLRGRLITRVDIPLNIRMAFAAVSRTPADQPIVCAALVRWTTGRTRLVLGGWGRSPSLAMDGPSSVGAEAAARNAAHEAHDRWASAEYRTEVAGVLAKRLLLALADDAIP